MNEIIIIETLPKHLSDALNSRELAIAIKFHELVEFIPNGKLSTGVFAILAKSKDKGMIHQYHYDIETAYLQDVALLEQATIHYQQVKAYQLLLSFDYTQFEELRHDLNQSVNDFKYDAKEANSAGEPELAERLKKQMGSLNMANYILGNLKKFSDDVLGAKPKPENKREYFLFGLDAVKYLEENKSDFQSLIDEGLDYELYVSDPSEPNSGADLIDALVLHEVNIPDGYICLTKKEYELLNQ